MAPKRGGGKQCSIMASTGAGKISITKLSVRVRDLAPWPEAGSRNLGIGTFVGPCTPLSLSLSLATSRKCWHKMSGPICKN